MRIENPVGLVAGALSFAVLLFLLLPRAQAQAPKSCQTLLEEQWNYSRVLSNSRDNAEGMLAEARAELNREKAARAAQPKSAPPAAAPPPTPQPADQP